jgi:hypothetical protein
MEHSVVEVRNARVPNAKLAEYAMPLRPQLPRAIRR